MQRVGGPTAAGSTPALTQPKAKEAPSRATTATAAACAVAVAEEEDEDEDEENEAFPWNPRGAIPTGMTPSEALQRKLIAFDGHVRRRTLGGNFFREVKRIHVHRCRWKEKAFEAQKQAAAEGGNALLPGRSKCDPWEPRWEI